MKVKIKHIKTGLYLSRNRRTVLVNPNGGKKHIRTNLSIQGREYNLPSEAQLRCWFKDYYDEQGKLCLYDFNDFELVTQESAKDFLQKKCQEHSNSRFFKSISGTELLIDLGWHEFVVNLLDEYVKLKLKQK